MTLISSIAINKYELSSVVIYIEHRDMDNKGEIAVGVGEMPSLFIQTNWN